MRELDTDYLVIGAGASGMAFVDALVAAADVDVIIVDRRHRPGGHWHDAYPFVRLHQASSTYGVASRVLGNDRIDESGPNAGYYERAGAAEIVDYFSRVLDEQLLASGKVRFLGMSDHRGSDGDGHRIVSLLDGSETRVRVRRKVVDATYVESSIPSRHRPGFEVDDGVRFIPPNELVDLDPAASGFTVVGAGKTAMDTCTWLLGAGVDANDIEWIRARDPWTLNRSFTQPLDEVGSYMQLQASWIEASAHASDGQDFARRLEERSVLQRIDESVEATAFRGATLSVEEMTLLRSIERVVRQGRVRRIASDRVELENGTVPAERGRVYVDCSAAGVRPTTPRPIFDGARLTLQYTTIGNVPHGAATVGFVEATRDDDADKNRLCPTVPFTGSIDGVLEMSYRGISGLTARVAEPDISAWNDACRLNPIQAASEHMDDPRVSEAFGTIFGSIGDALRNLGEKVGANA
jgi:hypothetical protein